MYSVSNAYLAAIKQPIQVHKVRGTIGSVAFTDENILEGSFSISNQSTDTSDIVLGSCYIGQLSATFTGLNISRTEWMNKVITPYFQLWFDSVNYEEVPLGVFTIKEVNHTAEGVEVVAYDNMYKFDKKFKKSGLNMVAKPYNFLIVFCQKCGIELGMNSTQVEALPNGNADLYLCGVRKSTTTYANDIETYRDALFWLAQCLGSFATMRRDGKLVLRAYKDTVDDNISDLYRLSGAKFADYITSYTGIYTESLYDGETTYYGYDLATLQQMRDTAMQQLEQIITDLAELEEEYAQGQITEEEYKAEKKRLTSEKKAKEKYISWLDKMIAQAQSEGDGAYMDLGANPFFQRRDANIPSIADATLATTLRSHILSALGKIEYTPFSCSSVFGVHYDLGDVIQFSGGHADDDLGCIMSYEWTLHGQYNMEGYGIDPDKQNVKDVKKKQSERAQKNALAASRNSTGTDFPVSPNDGDIHVVVNKITDEPLQMQYAHTVTSSGHPCDINNFSGNYKDGYSFSITGVPDGSDHGEHAYFDLQGLTDGVQYKVEFDGQFTQATGGWMHSGYSDGLYIGGTWLCTYPADLNEHHYSATFTYHTGDDINFLFYRVTDNNYYTYAVSNMKFTPVNGAIQGMEASVGGEWQNIDYVRTISQTQTSSGGEKIATANNSDGTTTDIYAPKITANPSGASTNLTSLGIAGTDYVIKDANAIPSTEKGANGGVAELDNSGKVPTSQLPSYVDDVVEYASRNAFPATGESGKIYIALDTNLTYRWSGSEYVEISPSLALGETSSTAYRGDRGKTAYDHATESGKISAAVASGLYKIAATAQGHIAGLTAVEKADITALGIPGSMPTVNNSTITIKKNGTTVDSFTLNQSSGKNIDISVPTKTSDLTNDSGFVTDGQGAKTVKASLVTLSDAAAIYAEDITADITAVQDLHGYSNPWVGGAGKNKLSMTVARIKAANSAFTWNGNVAERYGATATILTDGNDNVIGIKVNGTPSSQLEFYMPVVSNLGNVIINGCPANGSSTTYLITSRQGNTWTGLYDYGNGYEREITSNESVIIVIRSGYNAQNLIFYPMIRLATESDSTFAPYTNICPIQGHDECEVERVGKNKFDAESATYGKWITQAGTIASDTYGGVSEKILIGENTNITLSVNGTHPLGILIAQYNASDELVGRNYVDTSSTSYKVSVQVATGASYCYAAAYTSNIGTATKAIFNTLKLQLEFNNDATAYEPYQGQDYVMPLSNKNLIPMQFDNTHILAYNTSGSWNDHTYTEDGVDITVYTLTKYSDIVTGIRIKGTATDNFSFMLCSYGDDFVFTEALKMNANGSSNADIDIIAMDKNNTSKAEIRTTLSSADVSVTDNKFAKVVVIVNSGFSGDVMIYPQIRKARYSSDFEPHNPRLPEVVYGGTLDVTSGELVVDKGYRDLGSLSYSLAGTNLFEAAISDMGNNYSYSSNLSEFASDSYHAKYDWAGWNSMSHGEFGCNGNNVRLKNTDYSDATTFKTAMSGRQFVYPLATPTTYQLTPQEVKLLLNLNNITASTGQVQVKYQPNNAIGEAIGYIQDYIERHAPKTYYPKII